MRDRSPAPCAFFQDEIWVDLRRDFKRLQRRKLTTAPMTTSGASAIKTANSDSDFGVINSRTIPAVIQSVPKAMAKSIPGTRFQYRTAKMTKNGAIAAPIMYTVSSFGVRTSITIEARSHRLANIAAMSSFRTALSPLNQPSTGPSRASIASQLLKNRAAREAGQPCL